MPHAEAKRTPWKLTRRNFANRATEGCFICCTSSAKSCDKRVKDRN